LQKEAAMARVKATQLSVVHAGSGKAVAVFPDVCKIPAPPAPFIPIAYPSTAPPLPAGKVQTKAQTRAVLTKDSVYSSATGDEAGTLKGMSSTNAGITMMNELQTLGFSQAGAKLMVEGKPVETAQDQMLLYSILARTNVTRSETKVSVKRRGVP
jgi:hypothetical protein